MSLKSKLLKSDAATGIDFQFPGSDFIVTLCPVSRQRRQEIIKSCEIEALPGLRSLTPEYDDDDEELN